MAYEPLKFRQLLTRFIAVCNAIAYAHSRGVLHRDLKPSNIMLGEFGETLVVDWGLAKVLASPQKEEGSDGSTGPVLLPTSTSDSDLTHTGQALGTPAYMSPEQAAGRLDQLGPASDIYGLGATLYNLLTGLSPFAKSNVGEVLNQVQRGDFPPPRRVNRQVPAALEAICLRAMALQPRDRYASAKTLADDVEHWLADEAVMAHAESWQAQLGRWVRHHRVLVSSIAAVVLVGLTVAVATWLVREAGAQQTKEQELRGLAEGERDRADQQAAETEKQRGEAATQRDLSRRYLYFSRINLADRAWQEAHITRMDELLEQTQPEHMGGEDLRGFEWDYLMRLRHANLLDLKGHAGAVHSVAFSPNGQRLASASGDGTVKVWDARTSQEVLTLKGHTGPVLSVAFSPDSQRLASASSDKTVKIWDARTGQESLTLKGHTFTIWSVAFSPDGQRLASASYDQTVKVWDARTGQECLTLKGHTGFVNSVVFSPDGQHLASASHDGTVKVWDATPVSEESDLQRQALSFFRFVAETVVLKDDMIQQIRQTPTLSEPAREQALALAQDYREIPDRLNSASWSVVRGSWAPPGAYPLALRQAQAACRQEPKNSFFLNTLGIAQYRNGQYAAALKTLTQSEKLNAAVFKQSHPVDLAFLAMTQFQLGQKTEAAATLGRLRDVMKQLPADREAEEIAREAENLIEPKK